MRMLTVLTLWSGENEKEHRGMNVDGVENVPLSFGRCVCILKSKKSTEE